MILLDTHVLIWQASEPKSLSRPAFSAIGRAARSGGLAISAISLWELAWLATHGRLRPIGTVEAYVEEVTAHVAVRPITGKIAVLANQFPPEYSNDPCDRLIGATALAEGMALVTKDERIRACQQIQTIW